MVVMVGWLLGGCSGNQGPQRPDISETAVVPAPAPTDPEIGDDGLYPDERAALKDELPRVPSVADTPSAMGHFHVGRQASTHYRGPLTNDAQVQIRWFETESGIDIGTSPWHVISPRSYGNGVATLWGVGLTHAYKFALDNEFHFLDTFRINRFVSSIPWNLIARSDGRILVPDQNGYLGGEGGLACATMGNSFVVLNDDPSSILSEITCERVVELDEDALQAACGVQGATLQPEFSGTLTIPLFSGDLATPVVFTNGEVQTSYLAVLTNDLQTLADCTEIGPGVSTNAIAAEPQGPSVTAMYAVTETAMIKMTWDSATQSVDRAYVRNVPVRFRTGTTPTLVNTSDGERLTVFVDARCAVQNLLNGLIVCDDDTGASQLVAVRRDDDLQGRAAVLTTELPPWLDTVENSPSARGDLVVVANYSGYVPNGLKVPAGGQRPTTGPGEWGVSPDAVPDVAKGLAALRWNPAIPGFEVAWAVSDRQVSGVPTISGGANLVYGSGTEEETGKTYLYGFRLADDDQGSGGDLVVRVEIADAPFRTAFIDLFGNRVFRVDEYTMAVGEFYDAGNNLLIHSDRSAIVSGGAGLARIRDQVP